LDLIAYDRRTAGGYASQLAAVARTISYNNKVFIAPPWEEIFCNDSERRQTYKESVEIYESICSVYTEYGCELVTLPKASVLERIEFIMDWI
jgi:predicted ATPase